MRKINAIIAAVVALATMAVLGSGRAQDGARDFQLVFQSDTRAYYLPCG